VKRGQRWSKIDVNWMTLKKLLFGNRGLYGNSVDAKYWKTSERKVEPVAEQLEPE
jgi:hypothetical protein